MTDEAAAPRRGRGGRPRARAGDLRTCVVNFCCSPGEAAAIRRRAEAVGLRVRAYARQCALAGSAPAERPRLTSAQIEHAAALARLVSDLASVAAAVRAGRVPAISADALDQHAEAVTVLGVSLLKPGGAR